MSEREPHPWLGNAEQVPVPSSYHINSATHADLEKLKITIPPPEDDPEQHEYCLSLQEKGKSRFFILREGEDIVGCANLYYDWQSPYLPNIQGPYVDGIAVTESRRGRKLVDKLLHASESEIQSRGGKEIYLGVYMNNQPAIKAYKRNGYQEVPGSAHTLPREVDPEQIPEAYFKKSLS